MQRFVLDQFASIRSRSIQQLFVYVRIPTHRSHCVNPERLSGGYNNTKPNQKPLGRNRKIHNNTTTSSSSFVIRRRFCSPRKTRHRMNSSARALVNNTPTHQKQNDKPITSPAGNTASVQFCLWVRWPFCFCLFFANVVFIAFLPLKWSHSRRRRPSGHPFLAERTAPQSRSRYTTNCTRGTHNGRCGRPPFGRLCNG